MKIAIGACRDGHCDMAHPILCGECPDDNAYVIAPDADGAFCGVCSICGHTVWLGRCGVDWQHSPEDIADILAEEILT